MVARRSCDRYHVVQRPEELVQIADVGVGVGATVVWVGGRAAS
jgi:hypothetical protein